MLWEEISNDDNCLSQGEYISSCEIPVYSYETDELELTTYNTIVLNQSCDLQYSEHRERKIDWVTLCPVFDNTQYLKWVNRHRKQGDEPKQFKPAIYNQVWNGGKPGLFLISNPYAGFEESNLRFVNLTQQFSLPYERLVQISKAQSKRYRLKSPFVEKLAQSFGTMFSRVALPDYPFA